MPKRPALPSVRIMQKGKVVGYRLPEKYKHMFPEPTPAHIFNNQLILRTRRFVKVKGKVEENLAQIKEYIDGMGVRAGPIGEDIQFRLEENKNAIEAMKASIDALENSVKRTFNRGIPKKIFTQIRALRENVRRLELEQERVIAKNKDEPELMD